MRVVIKGFLLYFFLKKEMIDEILNFWEEEKKVNLVFFVEVINFFISEFLLFLMIIFKEMRFLYYILFLRV